MSYTALLVLTATLTGACAGVKVPQASNAPKPPAATMWKAPDNIASRDLFNGPWGAEHAPDPDGVYTLVERKHSGVNLGLTVKDEQGREWSVKQPFPGGLDSEAPVEVTLSRILSGVGYPQPPVYFLPALTVKDDFGTHVEVGGRFRLKDKSLKETGLWKWEDNPFVGTKPYQGLIVMLMMFNSTDLKNTNNSLYEFRNGDLVEQWYVARDIGSALGDLNPVSPRKNHLESFERVPFLTGVQNGHVQFHYSSWYKNLVRDRITPEDVAWASDLLGKLSDQQLKDAFRAGGFKPVDADRFIARLRAKIDEGRAIGSRAADRN
jgi:hypothetical protein